MDTSLFRNKKIVCPHCNAENDPHDGDFIAEYFDENHFEDTCLACGKNFFVLPHAQWTWTTAINEDEL